MKTTSIIRLSLCALYCLGAESGRTEGPAASNAAAVRTAALGTAKRRPAVKPGRARQKAKPASLNDSPGAEHGPLPFRGWGYLAEKLRQDVTDEAAVRAIYEDPRMPEREPVYFALEPGEGAGQYRSFTQPKQLGRARDCLTRYDREFARAESDFQVDRHLLAAILMVETQCGRYLGDDIVLNRLSRVAGAADPENLAYNLKSRRGKQPPDLPDRLRRRARYLEDTFYPEIPALIEVAARNKLGVFDIRGSSAGAFGMPQFLPSAYLRFGVDADRDGRISLFAPADAIASAANFLSSYGWRDEAPASSQRQVIWRYNHSPAYVDAVMKMTALLGAPPVSKAPAKKAPRQRSAGKLPRKRDPKAAKPRAAESLRPRNYSHSFSGSRQIR